jgi:hypothetical protein
LSQAEVREGDFIVAYESYDGAGALTSTRLSTEDVLSGTTTLSRNALSQLVSVGGGGFVTSKYSDGTERERTAQLPDGSVVVYGYTDAGEAHEELVPRFVVDAFGPSDCLDIEPLAEDVADIIIHDHVIYEHDIASARYGADWTQWPCEVRWLIQNQNENNDPLRKAWRDTKLVAELATFFTGGAEFELAGMALKGALRASGVARGGRSLLSAARSLACRSGACKPGAGYCFTGTTPVLVEEGTTHIEDIEVGDRVLSTRRDETCPTAVAADWIVIDLEAAPDNQPLDVHSVTLLRPAAALDDFPDGRGRLALPELGLEGEARVVGVRPAPVVEDGAGCVVTMTIQHMNNARVDVTLSSGEVIETTALHPFWSEDRGAWVQVQDLVEGEHVGGFSESLTIIALEVQAAAELVHNIEVENDHTYFVGDSGAWVHNANCAGELHVLVGDHHTSVAIVINDEKFVTHLIIGKRGAAEIEATGYRVSVDRMVFSVSAKQAESVRRLMNSRIGDAGKYERGVNSCVTYVEEVMRRAGLNTNFKFMESDDGVRFIDHLRELGGVLHEAESTL